MLRNDVLLLNVIELKSQMVNQSEQCLVFCEGISWESDSGRPIVEV